MKVLGCAVRKWGAAAVLLSVGFFTISKTASAQVIPPAQTIPEAPSLNNETLKPLDYSEKYDVYAGFASSHFNSGPYLVAGANLGGFDIQGTRWLSKRIGATANIRGYYGTQGVLPNPYNIHGPFVYEHQFMGGGLGGAAPGTSMPHLPFTVSRAELTAYSTPPSTRG